MKRRETGQAVRDLSLDPDRQRKIREAGRGIRTRPHRSPQRLCAMGKAGCDGRPVTRGQQRVPTCADGRMWAAQRFLTTMAA
jgi:hypothetical protein